jgi:hypothetical protein
LLSTGNGTKLARYLQVWISAIVQSAQFSDVIERMIGRSSLEQLFGARSRAAYDSKADGCADGDRPDLPPAARRGHLVDHAAELHGVRMSNSAHSQRREALPVELFEAICASTLRPLAEASRHQDCFFEGLRLLVADGSQSSVQDTPVLK